MLKWSELFFLMPRPVFSRNPTLKSILTVDKWKNQIEYDYPPQASAWEELKNKLNEWERSLSFSSLCMWQFTIFTFKYLVIKMHALFTCSYANIISIFLCYLFTFRYVNTYVYASHKVLHSLSVKNQIYSNIDFFQKCVICYYDFINLIHSKITVFKLFWY